MISSSVNPEISEAVGRSLAPAHHPVVGTGRAVGGRTAGDSRDGAKYLIDPSCPVEEGWIGGRSPDGEEYPVSRSRRGGRRGSPVCPSAGRAAAGVGGDSGGGTRSERSPSCPEEAQGQDARVL